MLVGFCLFLLCRCCSLKYLCFLRLRLATYAVMAVLPSVVTSNVVVLPLYCGESSFALTYVCAVLDFVVDFVYVCFVATYCDFDV